MQQSRDRTVRDTHRILEELNFEGMAYAGGAGINTAKICLDGTRTEILRDIMNWINDSGSIAPRILWLHGQAGRGKSAIAHTIASWVKDVGGLGSCFVLLVTGKLTAATRRFSQRLLVIWLVVISRSGERWRTPCRRITLSGPRLM
ncbi:hypothetical protein EDD16DRAFT_836324 [Pisolithus croceorrhizus]|nr:hypothetical protein EDD16DRAFT_836324 [Pisolithus croceorrhizus]